MTVQQEMNVLKMYNDGLNHLTEIWRKNQTSRTSSVEDLMDRVTQKLSTGFEMYGEWLEACKEVYGYNFSIYQKVMNGEKPDTDEYFTSSEEKYGKISEKMMQYIEDTPLEMMKPMFQPIMDSLNGKNNGQLMKMFVQPVVDMNLAMLSAMKSSYQDALEPEQEPSAVKRGKKSPKKASSEAS